MLKYFRNKIVSKNQLMFCSLIVNYYIIKITRCNKLFSKGWTNYFTSNSLYSHLKLFNKKFKSSSLTLLFRIESLIYWDVVWTCGDSAGYDCYKQFRTYGTCRTTCRGSGCSPRACAGSSALCSACRRACTCAGQCRQGTSQYRHTGSAHHLQITINKHLLPIITKT